MRTPTALMVLGVLLGTAGCLPHEDDAAGMSDTTGMSDTSAKTVRPPCVTTYKPSDQITLQLGTSYNASSDYFWDGSLLPSNVGEQTPSCSGIDGLANGSTITFTISSESAGLDEACMPFMSTFRPETLTPFDGGPQTAPMLTGVSIAVSWAEGMLAGDQGVLTRALFTPSMDPNGPLVARQLPPLAFTREITWADDGICFDSWVGTLVPSP